jgi:hypothetical protein
MTDETPQGGNRKMSLGQAVDAVIGALGQFEPADQQTILRAVYDHLKITGPTKTAADGGGAKEPAAEVEPAVHSRKPVSRNDYAGMDIREFRRLKSPSSARQMACVVAFYLSEIAEGDEKKTVVTAADLERYFKQGDYPLPKNPDQLLIDARGGGYFDNAARGEYRLTRVGYNLVAHQLPPKAKG